MNSDQKIVSRMYKIARFALTVIVPLEILFLSVPFLLATVPELRLPLLSVPLPAQIGLFAILGLLYFIVVYMLLVWIRTFFQKTVCGSIEDIEIRIGVLWPFRWVNLTVGGNTWRVIDEACMSERLQVGMVVSLRVDDNGMISQIEW